MLALAVLAAACASATPTPTPGAPPGPATSLSPCRLSAPGLPARLPAECGTLTVFEDRASQTGRQINLHVAVIRAVNRNPAPEPLFFLTGGPGQAATESFVQVAGAFDQVIRQRDIVLVDQRGTGQSNPLRCPEDEDASLLDDIDLAQIAVACLTALDADPRFYTTALAVADLDDVRAALGYPAINIYGVSYGTRVALSYLRQYPDHTRAVILDGVVPQEDALGLYVARDAQRALDLLFERCAADAGCQRAFPDLRASFAALSDRLQAGPVRLTVAHPATGQPTEMDFTYDTFALSVRLLSYAPETLALLPLLIHTAHEEDDLRLLAAQGLLVSGELSDSISEGLNISVLCAEDAPFITETQAADANQGAYLGSAQTDQLRDLCAIWPRGDLPEGFKQPVSSSVPVLLLSGETDPVTPPENAERAARGLSNSLHLVAPGQGHNVILRGCLPRVAADFLASASVDGLSADCVQDLRPMPFFVSFAGPEP